MITAAQIQKLATRSKRVRRVAVENFLGTISNNPSAFAATQNLYNDARAYNWNAETQAAIRRGIKIHFNGRTP